MIITDKNLAVFRMIAWYCEAPGMVMRGLVWYLIVLLKAFLFGC